jgi:hypothetical protein
MEIGPLSPSPPWGEGWGEGWLLKSLPLQVFIDLYGDIPKKNR